VNFVELRQCEVRRILLKRTSENAQNPKFAERRYGEVPRIPLPRTRVNKGMWRTAGAPLKGSKRGRAGKRHPSFRDLSLEEKSMSQSGSHLPDQPIMKYVHPTDRLRPWFGVALGARPGVARGTACATWRRSGGECPAGQRSRRWPSPRRPAARSWLVSRRGTPRYSAGRSLRADRARLWSVRCGKGWFSAWLAPSSGASMTPIPEERQVRIRHRNYVEAYLACA
jgi:hypothetical protein